MSTCEIPQLSAEDLTKFYGDRLGFSAVTLDVYAGEVLGVVGESGSGKSTLLSLLSTQLRPTRGRVQYRMRDGLVRDLFALGEAERRFLLRTDWGFVHQDGRVGLRMGV